MSVHANLHFCTSWEGADLVVMSRVENLDGEYVTQATISSIAVSVYNRQSRELIGSESPTVSSVVYNTLQTGDIWTEDETGYNFKYTVPGSLFPDGDVTYRVEIWATPLSGSAFPLAMVDVESQERYSG